MNENEDILRALKKLEECRREREAEERALASLKTELAEAEKRDEDSTQELQTRIRMAELAIRNLRDQCIQLDRIFRSYPVKATRKTDTGEGS